MDRERLASDVAAALQAGDRPGAERIARAYLATMPDDGFALSLLGQVLFERGALEEAVTHLRLPQALAARPESYNFLAHAQRGLGAVEECEAALETRKGLSPPMPIGDYALLAKLKAVRGEIREARNVLKYGLAHYPDQLALAVGYIDMTFELDPDTAFTELDAYLKRMASTPGAVPLLLRCRTTFRARLREKALGIESYPASWEQVWNWLDPEGLAAFEQAARDEAKSGKTNVELFLDLGALALVRGQWEEAGSVFKFARKRRPGTYADAAGFGATFHRELDAVSDDDLTAGLVPVQRLRELETNEPALYLASDPKYFVRFSLPFLRTLNAQAPGQAVQVHILDGEESEWRDLLHAVEGLGNIPLGFSAEASGVRKRPQHQARFYYHAVRFIRLYDELKHRGRPLWLLDADVQVTKDPRADLAKLVEFDLALAGRWHTLDPILKMWACCVGVSPTPRGLAYLRRVAAYVRHWMNRGAAVWGTDQLALLSCYIYHVEQGAAPRTLFLQPDFVGTMGEATGALRFMGGLRKYQ